MPVLRIAISTLLLALVVGCAGSSQAVRSIPIPAATSEQPKATTQASSPIATATPDSATPTWTPTPEPIAAWPTSTVPPPTPSVTDLPTVTPTQEPTEPDADARRSPTSEELVSAIDALVTGREGHYGVVVIGPGGEPHYTLDADRQVQSASLYKLLVMVEVFRQMEDGAIAPDDPVFLREGYFKEVGYDDPFQPSDIGSTVTVEALLRPMVALSSNVAAFALLDLVGNWNINQTVADLGMTASEIRWMPAVAARMPEASPSSELASYASLALQTPASDETPSPPTADESFNVTSAADTALLFQLLIEGEVISPDASEAMLDLLAAQAVNDRLPALLPTGAVVAHKTGNIDNVIHDAGVIYTPAGPAAVVVLTESALEWEAVEFMRELGRLVYEYGSG